MQDLAHPLSGVAARGAENVAGGGKRAIVRLSARDVVCFPSLQCTAPLVFIAVYGAGCKV